MVGASSGAGAPRGGEKTKGLTVGRRQAMTLETGRGRIMKVVISLQLALQTVILAIVFSAAGRADDAETAVSRRGLHGKVQYCKDCHGLSAQGYRGYLIMPRLAGQTAEYIENQLRAFAERRRAKDLFINMAKVHGLSPAMRTALAAHFRSLDARPIGGAPKPPEGTGKTIYDDGMPEANVPACAACHGPEAKGEGPIPRLAGQLYPYLVKELTNWNRERQNESAAIMEPIAHGLTKSQIAAVAAYVSNLK
jgi:cytochrome c553